MVLLGVPLNQQLLINKKDKKAIKAFYQVKKWNKVWIDQLSYPETEVARLKEEKAKRAHLKLRLSQGFKPPRKSTKIDYKKSAIGKLKAKKAAKLLDTYSARERQENSVLLERVYKKMGLEPK